MRINLWESIYKNYCDVDLATRVHFIRDEVTLRKIQAMRGFKYEIVGHVLNTAQLCGITSRIFSFYSSSVIVLADNPTVIGGALLPDLNSFICDFDLSYDANGIVSVVDEKFSNEMLIDFTLLDREAHLYEVIVEIYGEEWVSLFQK